jgi:hypothetical protein
MLLESVASVLKNKLSMFLPILLVNVCDIGFPVKFGITLTLLLNDLVKVIAHSPLLASNFVICQSLYNQRYPHLEPRPTTYSL